MAPPRPHPGCRAGAREGRPAGYRALAPIPALLLAACAQPPPPPPDLASINQRLTRLEAQLDSLERLLRNLPSPPLRSRAEIVANVRALERQRAELLQKYTPAHPDVREIDLRLRLLRLQLEFLDQAPPASP